MNTSDLKYGINFSIFINSFVHSFVRSFMHFIHSFMHLFICFLVFTDIKPLRNNCFVVLAISCYLSATAFRVVAIINNNTKWHLGTDSIMAAQFGHKSIQICERIVNNLCVLSSILTFVSENMSYSYTLDPSHEAFIEFFPYMLLISKIGFWIFLKKHNVGERGRIELWILREIFIYFLAIQES